MTQYSKIITKLYGDGTITAKDARRMGIKNLRARVCEMRDRGHLIMTKMKSDGGFRTTRRGNCTTIEFVPPTRIWAEYTFFQRTDYYKNR